MLINVSSYTHHSGTVVSVRCPSCRQQGTFDAFANILDLFVNDPSGVHTVLGQRRCPNSECRTHIFFISQLGKLRTAYPAERLDFDASSIPKAIASALEEAITCHATQCYSAAAIMVRKTLEELCHERGAAGPNLKERIKALGSKVVIPQELIEGMDHLRLLGNDAAHIESQNFNKVGQEEIEVGILFAKEVLKAVYQYSSLVGRLKALQKASPAT